MQIFAILPQRFCFSILPTNKANYTVHFAGPRTILYSMQTEYVVNIETFGIWLSCTFQVLKQLEEGELKLTEYCGKSSKSETLNKNSSLKDINYALIQTGLMCVALRVRICLCCIFIIPVRRESPCSAPTPQGTLLAPLQWCVIGAKMNSNIRDHQDSWLAPKNESMGSFILTIFQQH